MYDNLIHFSKFQNFLYRLRKKNDNLKEEIYYHIRPISAATPILYSVPKFYKDNVLLRQGFPNCVPRIFYEITDITIP